MGARIAPERRTRVDLIVTAVIVVAVVVAGALVWATSGARTSELTVAGDVPPAPEVAEATPTALREVWTARSAATPLPQLTQNSVLTADGGTVTAHDVRDGSPVWTYRRDLPLCGALAAWPSGENRVLAVYRNSRGCGEVTGLRGDTGARFGARSSDADDAVTLGYDGDHVLSAGTTRLETWGTNLVRGIEYGRVDAVVNPDVTPGREHCRIYSALPGGNRIGLIERCDGDVGYRLTVLGSSLDSKEKVIQWGTTMLTTTAHGPAPQIVSGGSGVFTVYDGGTDATGEVGRRPGARLRVYTAQAEALSQHTVEGPAQPPTGSVPVVDQGMVTFWTGAATVVIDASTGAPLFQALGTVGPGSVMAGELLLPMPGRISVRQLSDGREVRSIPVDRHGYDADRSRPVSVRVLGTSVVEQRGDTVVVLS